MLPVFDHKGYNKLDNLPSSWISNQNILLFWYRFMAKQKRLYGVVMCDILHRGDFQGEMFKSLNHIISFNYSISKQ